MLFSEAAAMGGLGHLSLMSFRWVVVSVVWVMMYCLEAFDFVWGWCILLVQSEVILGCFGEC